MINQKQLHLEIVVAFAPTFTVQTFMQPVLLHRGTQPRDSGAAVFQEVATCFPNCTAICTGYTLMLAIVLPIDRTGP